MSAVFDIGPGADLKTTFQALGTAIRMLLADGPVRVQVKPGVHPRSLEQNDMWHGLCRDAAEWWNANRKPPTTAEAIARDLKVTYGVICTEFSPVTGKRVARIESTAKYTKQQMGDLITATLAWAADNGIPLPDPRQA